MTSFGDRCFPTTLVLMPKAPVDEKSTFPFWKNNIGFAGQVLPLQSESQPHLMERTPDDNFRPSVCTPDAAHYFGALRLRKAIHSQLT
jgi:hypothetical protein